MKSLLGIVCLFAVALQGAGIAGDSSRGYEVFQSLRCIECHSVNGEGGKAGPDLGHRLDRGMTPSALAATMWNHAPTMWVAMRERGILPGNLDESAAMNLFAYFYSAHFFDPPGDAGRGKQAFAAAHCAECHAPTQHPLNTFEEPVALADAMWNHAAGMREEFAQRKLKWPELTAHDLTDILVYLRNLPAESAAPVRMEISAGAAGQMLFESKGCASCHRGRNDLASEIRGQTLTDIAVEMWNHAPEMAPGAPQLDVSEMREIVSYVWAQQFFEGSGSAAAGQRVFKSKHCAGCHEGSGAAPKLTGAGKTFTGASMVSALWHHGPTMLAQMQAQGIAWPRFEGQDMANLIAYLNRR